MEKYILCHEPEKYQYEGDEESIDTISTVTSVMSQEFINLKYGEYNREYGGAGFYTFCAMCHVPGVCQYE